MFNSMKDYFNTGATLSYQSRLKSLDQLEKMIRENSPLIADALKKDLNKPEQESLVSEVIFLIEEIKHTKKHLKNWMKVQDVGTPLTLLPAKSFIYQQPKGIVLIIAPWNYPFQLAIAPVIAALAAGNCVVLKPSELTPNTSKLIHKLIGENFSDQLIQVVEGGIQETTDLLKEKFDHIFFTGSTPVGKIIMLAAAQNLTPVTLELGGKSPVIVCEDANLDLCARRLVWAKFYNAGQTCVAPDYVYVHESIKDQLIEKMIQQIHLQFGQNPQESQSFARMVNTRNWQRVFNLIEKENIIHGGVGVQDDLYIAPTLLYSVNWDSKVMKDEIFGPLLPIMTFKNHKEVFSIINQRPRPLAAYIFSESKSIQKEFGEELYFGGGCINDLMVHLSHPDLPFGGVGDSGMGHYHGLAGFLTFSHSKSVLRRYAAFDFSARYAPYDTKKLNFFKRIFGLR